ncbi:DUF4307 domain-containing protein [Streptomyces sp. NPDC058045]|uniref:DUF4307 domain-containing protein n=1 Tax=Streptomyces sp. NPDC058045 TaxID=3346311 RepID=UPI0036E44087
MTAVRAGDTSGPAAPAPADRYGRTRDQRTDRTLRRIGAVLGVLLIGAVAWFGYGYITGTKISAEVIKFKAVSDSAVEAHLEVHKDAGTGGYCTLRSLAADGSEVGRADFRFGQHRSRIDTVVTLRTTARGTSAELVGCQAG